MPLDDPCESSLFPFTATDGENLALRDWPLPAGAARRGTVMLVHGLGEHSGRYDTLAQRLNQWGFAVRGYDHYGHGHSSGPRGGLSSPLRLVDDLADLIDATRRRFAGGLPLVVLGHSMGGLVAAHLVARRMRTIEGLVLSSPALHPRLNALQRLLLATVPRIAPDWRVANGLDVNALSHDPQVAADYRSDRLCHDRISARLARYIADAGPATLQRATGWQVPTLLLWSGNDQLVDPAGSAAFAHAAPPSVVQSQAFGPLYHELFNESTELAAPVFEALGAWLQQRFALRAPRGTQRTFRAGMA